MTEQLYDSLPVVPGSINSKKRNFPIKRVGIGGSALAAVLATALTAEAVGFDLTNYDIGTDHFRIKSYPGQIADDAPGITTYIGQTKNSEPETFVKMKKTSVLSSNTSSVDIDSFSAAFGGTMLGVFSSIDRVGDSSNYGATVFDNPRDIVNSQQLPQDARCITPKNGVFLQQHTMTGTTQRVIMSDGSQYAIDFGSCVEEIAPQPSATPTPTPENTPTPIETIVIPTSTSTVTIEPTITPVEATPTSENTPTVAPTETVIPTSTSTVTIVPNTPTPTSSPTSQTGSVEQACKTNISPTKRAEKLGKTTTSVTLLEQALKTPRICGTWLNSQLVRLFNNGEQLQFTDKKGNPLFTKRKVQEIVDGMEQERTILEPVMEKIFRGKNKNPKSTLVLFNSPDPKKAVTEIRVTSTSANNFSSSEIVESFYKNAVTQKPEIRIPATSTPTPSERKAVPTPTKTPFPTSTSKPNTPVPTKSTPATASPR